MAFGMFRMMFNAGGNAVPVIEQMTTASNKLVHSSGAVATSLRNQAGVPLRQSTIADKTNVGFVSLITRMEKLAATGQVSSSTLINLAKQMEVLGNVTAPTARRIQDFRNQLLLMSAGLKTAEQTAAKAGSPQGGFQMMTDVSTQTATKMRMMSSASQGAMIAMSLLQRNVTGLAFSLIFLQFSGFLKISLAIAGVIAVLGIAAMSIKALVVEGNRLKDLSNQIFIVTGSTTKFALAMDAAKKISESLGGGLTNEMLQGIVAVAMGTKASNDELQALGEAMILLKTGALKDLVGSQEELIKKFVEWQKSGKETKSEMGQVFAGLSTDTGMWQKRFENAFKVWDGSTKQFKEQTKERMGESFQPVAVNIKKFFDDLQISLMQWATVLFLTLTGKFGEAGKELNKMRLLQGEEAVGIEKKNNNQLLTENERANAEHRVQEAVNRLEERKKVKEFMRDELTRLQVSNEAGQEERIRHLRDRLDTTRDFFEVEKKDLASALRTLLEIETKMYMDSERRDRMYTDNRKAILAEMPEFAASIARLVIDDMDQARREKEPESKKDWEAFGKGLMASLLRGMEGFAIIGPILRLGRNVLNSFRRAFKEGSPSKEMMKIGENAMKGFTIGMGGSATSRNSSNINITINVKGAFSSDPRTASQSVATSVLKGMTRQGAFSGAPLVA